MFFFSVLFHLVFGFYDISPTSVPGVSGSITHFAKLSFQPLNRSCTAEVFVRNNFLKNYDGLGFVSGIKFKTFFFSCFITKMRTLALLQLLIVHSNSIINLISDSNSK